MKEQNTIKKIGNIIMVLQLIITIFLAAICFQIKILPTLYVAIITVILLLVWFVLFVIRLKNKRKKKSRWPLMIISMVLCVLYILVAVVGFKYYKSTVEMLDVNTLSDYETEAISVIVLNDSGYEKIEDLEGKMIAANMNEDQNNMVNSISEIKEIVNVEYENATDYVELSDMLYNGTAEAILVNEAYRAMLEINHKDFDYETTVIFQCEYISEKDKEANAVTNININDGVFTVYISGIDTYGKVSTKSRSDVNILVVVNSNTRQILLVSIPRDYYVELGTKGGLDKLTHAGIYGINESIATLTKLFDTDINYYYRINFSSLINIVDILGGIDIYSDKEFVPWGDRELIIKEGINHMDGRMALAYARERKSYAEGDNRRIKNQQDVLTAIIQEVFTPKTLMNYERFLGALEGSFETNMSTDEILSFMNMLLTDISNLDDWDIERVSAEGTGARKTTYSMPGHNLSVLIPNQESIDEAKEYINNILAGKYISVEK